ncbi:hypothetical protein BH24ACT3_BH24ACT3_10210 [soil metagenome]
MQQRLIKAAEERAVAAEIDAHVVVNDDLERAVEETAAVIAGVRAGAARGGP